MTTRTELIAELREYKYTLMARAADMLEADAKYVAINCPQCGFEGAREHAGSEQQAQIDKLQAAARLALDALEIAEKHLAYVEITEAIAALKEVLK